ncbi:YhgE/Pip family protein [Virgibacillus sp. JSM 102003]|uniref:YhgE/Pip family protein n=1 Tax=Virgibacillus sp. JSM 102003 TaxID=1562108 RepID=UPI0035C25C9D
MGFFKLLSAEFANMFKNKKLLISVIAVLLFPVIYSVVMLSSSAVTPYGENLDNLPVAVVNMDEGAQSGDEDVHAGDDLVKELKAEPTLKWEFVKQDVATKGLKNGDYYMVIEIPKDFSKNVTTVMEENPQPPELKYIQNEGLHFTASTITDSAIKQISQGLSYKITANYTQQLFTQLAGISDGFKQAADGSNQIAAGTEELSDGTSEMLESLKGKSGDISTLADGAKQLEQGTGQLLSSLNEKSPDISRLAGGAQQLEEGTGQLLGSLKEKSPGISDLDDGAKQLNAGLGQMLGSLKEKSPRISELAKGAKDLELGTKELKQGAVDILGGIKLATAGSKELNAGLEQLESGSGQLSGLSQQLFKDLGEYAKKNPSLMRDPEFKKIMGESMVLAGKDSEISGVPQLAAGISGAKSGAQKLVGDGKKTGLTTLVNKVEGEFVPGMSSLANGATKVAAGTAASEEGWGDLVAGTTKLAGGASQVSAGTTSVEQGWSDLTAGATELSGGASQVSAGTDTVEQGWGDLTAGATKLNSGSSQVSDGTASVEQGWGELSEGVTQLDDGAGQLTAGSEELHTKLQDAAEQTAGIQTGDENVQMFAAPFQLNGEQVNGISEYRQSTAPYILSLALFVGALIISLVINFRKPVIAPSSGLQWFASKFVKVAVLATIQAIVLTAVTIGVLGLPVEGGFSLLLFAILTSITFVAIVQLFVTVGGTIGKFLAGAFIILQLQTTGGPLPIDLLPASIRTLSNFLPMTYTIDGFKSIINMGQFNSFDVIALLIFLAISAVGTFVYFTVAFSRNSDQSERYEELTA